MPTQWTINSAQGGQDGQQLVGCRIQLSNDGLHYEFTSRNNSVLATTAGSTLPTVPFFFPEFAIPAGPAVWNWNIQVTTFSGGPSLNRCQGTWANNDPNPTAEESGTYTAQAGQGEDEDGKEDAASAYA